MNWWYDSSQVLDSEDRLSGDAIGGKVFIDRSPKIFAIDEELKWYWLLCFQQSVHESGQGIPP